MKRTVCTGFLALTFLGAIFFGHSLRVYDNYKELQEQEQNFRQEYNEVKQTMENLRQQKRLQWNP